MNDSLILPMCGMLANIYVASLSSSHSHRSYNNVHKSIHHHPINCQVDSQLYTFDSSVMLVWCQLLNDVASQVSIVRHNLGLESCVRRAHQNALWI